MSVWDNPCYNVDPIRRAIRNLPAKDTDTFPPFLYGHVNFTTTKSTRTDPALSEKHLGDLFAGNPREWRRFRNKHRTLKPAKPDYAFTSSVQALAPEYAGLKAVYWAFSNIWNKNWRFKDEYASTDLVSFYEKVWELAPYASRVNATHWNNAGKLIATELSGEWERLDQASIAVNHIWVMDKSSSYKRHLRVSRLKGETYPYIKPAGRFGRLEIIKFRGGYILHDVKSKKSGILYYKDHTRLVNMLSAVAKCTFYFNAYEIGNTELNNQVGSAFRWLMGKITDAMLRLSWDDCNYICRAMDVCQFLYLSILGSDLSDRSKNDQLDKIRKEDLDRIIGAEEIVAYFEGCGLGVKETLELLKVYRILPTSDHDIYGIIDNFADKNDKVNPMDLNVSKKLSWGADLNLSEDEFDRYQKRNMMMTFRSRHGRFPGAIIDYDHAPSELLSYPNVQPDAITINNVHLIDITSSFQWKSFDGCEHELVKDKKTAAKSEDDESKFYGQNQILQYLFDPSFQSQASIRDNYAKRQYPLRRQIDVAIKAEAKKPKDKVRAFYMANDSDRRVLSEFEANVHEYVLHKAGSSVGKNEKEISERLYEICNWEEANFQPLLISFDIAAWSPKQNPKFKEKGLKLWADAFGKPHVNNLMDLFRNVDMVWNKFGVCGRYTLKGNDLEGFNGRMNTSMHIDVMGYAIRKCRDLGLVEHGGKFACFIDDGILNLQTKLGKQAEVVPRILEVIETVYWAFGLEISWDKTFVSEYFMQYLNKVYLDGQEITPGLKAFLRIGKLVDVPSPTIFTDMDNLASTVRGAIQAGTDHRIAYTMYLVEVFHIIKRWSRYDKAFKVTNTLLMMMWVPRTLGGLGLSSLFSLSTNETFSSFEAGLACMRFLSHQFTGIREFYNSVIQGEVDDMESLAVLRAPRSIRIREMMLKEDRLSRAAVAVVKAKAVNPFIRSVSELAKAGVSSVCADVIAQTDLIHDFTRERLWKIDPMNVIESIVGKLQTSSTAASLIGRKKMLAILIANRFECARFIMQFQRGIK